MKIGIIKEGKNPPDKRVPLSPKQAAELKEKYNTEVVVQKSDVRKFQDNEYENEGVEVVDNVDDCAVLMGVKEVPIGDLIENKTYFFFSHTIKEQPYNQKLLQAALQKNITLIDYETLTDKQGRRLLGFGRYAGIVGAYNGFYAWGMRNNSYSLKRAHLCDGKEEMLKELDKVELQAIKIIITGKGRVGQGAKEIISQLKLREVTQKEFLTQEFNEPVYCHIDADGYNKRKDGEPFVFSHFFENPEEYENDFLKFTKVADLFIACHYWDADAPVLFTKEDARASDFKIKVVTDISCDIKEPIASTIRPSTIEQPLYGYNKKTGEETEFNAEGAITVMAVDNLPCELPKDSSAGFGQDLLDKVFPCLLGDDPDDVIGRATIAKDGKLTPHFAYLQGYVDGN